MESQLTIRYDPIADELSLDLVPRYAEQMTDEIEPGVIVRSNPETYAVESVDIIDFTQRTQDQLLRLPLRAGFGTLDRARRAA